MSTKYTYADFAKDVITLLSGDEIKLTDEKRNLMTAKANDLLGQQVKRAEYSATHPSTKKPKGASADTMGKANTIRAILTANPMTAAEISDAAGIEFTALQVANACKFIPGVATCKVIRETVNTKGLKAQKEYTAYYLV